MNRLFLDTEFTEMTPDAKLISIALVSEYGDEFYVELSDTWRPEDLSEFSRKHVVPLLDGHPRMTWLETAFSLHSWVEKQGKCTVALDSLTYDHMWFTKLLSDPAVQAVRGWPQNLSREPLLLTVNYLENYDRFAECLEQELASRRHHHAKDDATANREAWRRSGGDIFQG